MIVTDNMMAGAELVISTYQTSVMEEPDPAFEFEIIQLFREWEELYINQQITIN